MMQHASKKSEAFDPGDLRFRIAITRPVFAASEPWHDPTDDTLVVEVWAALLDIATKEHIEAGTTGNSKTIRFAIRHRTDLDEATKVSFDDQSYYLTSMKDPDMRKRWLIITARSVIGDE